MKRFLRFLLDLSRELGDETAYRRYLTMHGLAHSPDCWRHFFEQRMRAKYSRAKCC